MKLNWGLKKKLVVGFCISGFIPMLVIAYIAIDRSKVAVEEQEFSSLAGQKDQVNIQLQAKFKEIINITSTISDLEETLTYFELAKSAFGSHISDLKTTETKSFDSIKEDLWSYYSNSFKTEYIKRNAGNSPKFLKDAFDSLDQESVYAQYDFIFKNPNPLGEKDKMFHSELPTGYNKIHERIHHDMRKTLNKFGLYDIFLVDAETGRVVYTVFKELDFATSLRSGPYRNTDLAKVFEKAIKLGSGEATISDLNTYSPSYDFPASFVGSPIVKEGKTIGAFIVQVPVDIIDTVTTNGRSWNKEVFGATGEIFLLGKDMRARSLSRQFAENSTEFGKKYLEFGGSQEGLSQMNAKQSNVLVESIDNESIREAMKKDQGNMIYSRKGKKVFSSFRKIDIEGLDWYVFSEIDESEVLQHIKSTSNYFYVAGALCLLLLVIVGVVFSQMIIRELVQIVLGIKENATQNKHASDMLGERAVALSASSNEQSAATQETMAAMSEISGMLRSTNEKTSESNTLILAINNKIDGGVALIEQLSKAMDTILDSTKNLAEFESIIVDIENKTKVINDIVFKTQLLSFNASIEAARAGQHGRGFSVVAEEVGNLADLSGKAAQEITGLLGHSSSKVKELVGSNAKSVEIGKKNTEQVTIFFSDISDSLTEMMANINSIVSATVEQETGVTEVGVAVKQLEASTISNSSIAQDVSGMADKANHLVGQMNSLVHKLSEIIYGEVVEHENSNLSSSLSRSSKTSQRDTEEENFDYESFKKIG